MITTDVDPPGLDRAAWDTWLEYRRALKKPLREPSWCIAKRKMAELGKHQMAAVEHSIANGYQGLFAPRELQETIDPSAPW
jgi:hypothetical protein